LWFEPEAFMLLSLLLSLACATPRAQNAPFPFQDKLLISVVPPAEADPLHQVTFLPVPRSASPESPWVCDDPRFSCRMSAETLHVGMTLDPKAWPYALPEAVNCAQGKLNVRVGLGFTAPSVSMWKAADGTIVVPHRPHHTHGRTFKFPTPLASAAVEPALPDVHCEVQQGVGSLYVTVDGEAQPGTAICRMVFATGERVDQQIAVIAY
jgi:hypothetical protein